MSKEGSFLTSFRRKIDNQFALTDLEVFSFIRVFLLHILYCQAKISLLKKACKDKDAAINDLSEEIRELRHSIATSALDDLSKIRTYGYSPENFVKLSSQREQQLQMAKRDPEVCALIMDNQSVCKIKFDAVVCYISKWLDFPVFLGKDYKPEVPSHNPCGK